MINMSTGIQCVEGEWCKGERGVLVSQEYGGHSSEKKSDGYRLLGKRMCPVSGESVSCKWPTL